MDLFGNKKLSNRGFTLIELLVVISIIGLLSSVVLASVNSARAKARDAYRRSSLQQLRNAVELRFASKTAIMDDYPVSAGFFTNACHGGLGGPPAGCGTVANRLAPEYIPVIPDDPLNSGNNRFMYYRKNQAGGPCTGSDGTKYSFYATLENPSASDLATISGSDAFDQCIGLTYGKNYRIGN